MSDPTDRPDRPARTAAGGGRPRWPPGTFDGTCVFVTGGGTGLGKAIASEFARLGASLVIASRKPEHLDAARAADGRARRPGPGRGLRHPRARRDRRRLRRGRGRSACPACSSTTRRPTSRCPAEDMSPNAWRTVVDITLNGTFFCSREFGRRHLAAGTPGSIVNIAASYAWTGGPGFAHSAAAKAGREEPDRVAGRRMGPLRHPGERAGARPVPPRGHDRRHPGQPRSHPRQGRLPARAAGRASARSSGGPPPSWPRPTPGSSRATPWSSTAPTGSVAA